MNNLFSDIPSQLPDEVFETIVSKSGIRIERILSDGHSTEDGEWYDQNQDEWVLVLKGSGTLEFEDGSSKTLEAGDHLHIPKHIKHRVSRTGKPTIWLAVHFD